MHYFLNIILKFEQVISVCQQKSLLKNVPGILTSRSDISYTACYLFHPKALCYDNG